MSLVLSSQTLLIILVGILISIIFYELTNISPGGIIVPGLMVMHFNEPATMIFTVVIALLTYLIVKFLSKYLIIFGKRRFVILIIISLVLSFILQLILKLASISLISLSIVGYTIPGLIANDLYKQGIKKTIPSLAICVLVVELIVIICTKIGF